MEGSIMDCNKVSFIEGQSYITKFAATHKIPKAINELDIIDLEYSG
jgi:hypothetical protein